MDHVESGQMEIVRLLLRNFEVDAATSVVAVWAEFLQNGGSIQHAISRLTAGVWNPSVDKVAFSPAGGFGCVQFVDYQGQYLAGSQHVLAIKARNHSGTTWKTTPEQPFNFSYHWFDADNNLYLLDGLRSPLPGLVDPASSTQCTIKVIMPSQPGCFRLMPSMVFEGKYWAEQVGLQSQSVAINILPHRGSDLTGHSQRILSRIAD